MRSHLGNHVNRLIDTNGNNGTANDQSWNLDALGNLGTVTTGGVAISRTHNAQNQIETLGASTLAYDNNGNTTDDQGRSAMDETLLVPALHQP